jgi:transcriptional regulator with XRE-family HTH domain
MTINERVSQSPERMKHFQSVRLEMEITELVCELMDKQGVSRAELATRMGTSAPYVTKLLRGQTNMTLKTISDLFFALGRSVRIVERPMSVHSPRLLVMEVASGESTRRANNRYKFNKLTTTETPKGIQGREVEPRSGTIEPQSGAA